MKVEETIEALQKLIQVDIDTIHAYNQAIDAITDRVILARILKFRNHHETHVRQLANEIRKLGDEPPAFKKDFKGYVVEAFTALGTITGMNGALKALRLTEEITNRYYGEAVSLKLPPPVKKIIRQHFTDEKIHLAYINSNK